VQVDPIIPTVKPPGTNRLKPKCDEPLSDFAFNFKLHRYNEVWASYGDTIRKMGIHSIPLFIFNSDPDGGPFRQEAGRTITHNGSGKGLYSSTSSSTSAVSDANPHSEHPLTPPDTSHPPP
jgi:hypothetical protein